MDEGADYIVVDKPPLLLAHPTKPGGPRTLWGELRHLLAYEIANGGQVSIVNRLDRETSGLVLIAKSADAARRFGCAMQQGQIAKEYLALVQGWPVWERQVVNAPLARQGRFRPSRIWLKQAIHPEGSPATTELDVENRFTRGERRFALVRAVPRTGRTHQIRVHLSSLGHPIVGDKIYGPDEMNYLRFVETGWSEELARELLLPRQALHSARITLPDGRSWASALPADLADFCRAIC